MVETYRPVLHEFEAGAEVGQADVAVHIQQNVVGLYVPERREKKRERLIERAIPQKTRHSSKQNNTYRTLKTHTSLISNYAINYHAIKLHNLGNFYCLNLLVKPVCNNSDVFMIQLSVISQCPFISSVTTPN